MIEMQFECGYALPPEIAALLFEERVRARGVHQFVSKLVTHLLIFSSHLLSYVIFKPAIVISTPPASIRRSYWP